MATAILDPGREQPEARRFGIPTRIPESSPEYIEVIFVRRVRSIVELAGYFANELLFQIVVAGLFVCHVGR
jgi:hypothetical protein